MTTELTTPGGYFTGITNSRHSEFLIVSSSLTPNVILIFFLILGSSTSILTPTQSPVWKALGIFDTSFTWPQLTLVQVPSNSTSKIPLDSPFLSTQVSPLSRLPCIAATAFKFFSASNFTSYFPENNWTFKKLKFHYSHLYLAIIQPNVLNLVSALIS